MERKMINIGRRELDPMKVRIEKFYSPAEIEIEPDGREGLLPVRSNKVTGMRITDGDTCVYVAFDRNKSVPIFSFEPGLAE